MHAQAPETEGLIAHYMRLVRLDEGPRKPLEAPSNNLEACLDTPAFNDAATSSSLASCRSGFLAF